MATNKRYQEIARQLESAGDHLNAAAGYIALARRGDRERYADAMENLLRVTKDNPDYVRAQTMLAEVLGEQGDARGGLAVLQRLLQGVTPTSIHVPALYQLGRLFELGAMLPAARDAYASARAIDPRFSDLEVRMARIETLLRAQLVPAAPAAPPAQAQAAVPAPILQTAPRPLVQGAPLLRDRYRLERKIGTGGQAEVHLATDVLLDRKVAIKILNEAIGRDRVALERFLREARLAARVQHPKCIAVYDFGQVGELTFMAMEYFEGQTLRERMRKARLEPLQAVDIAIDVAEALSAAHAQGIVHRDVKPSNVMVGAGKAVRLADFGVAWHVDSELTGSGMMIGSMGYMSPEQATGKEIDRRADIYALGIVLFEMLAGKPPFEANLESLSRRVTMPPPELPPALRIPPLLRRATTRAMEPSRDARYATAEDFANDLFAAKSQLENHAWVETKGVSGTMSLDIVVDDADDVEEISSEDVEELSTSDVDVTRARTL